MGISIRSPREAAKLTIKNLSKRGNWAWLLYWAYPMVMIAAIAISI